MACAAVGTFLLVGVAGADDERAAAARPAAAAASICDRMARPSGNDRWPGTGARPYRTVQKLADSLRPGETGCLRGVFEEDQIIIRRGGRSGSPVRLRSEPGTRATIRGRLTIQARATDIVVSGLNLDGRNVIDGASPTVLGDRIVFRNNDVTNYDTEICFILGSVTNGHLAEGTVIDGNRIHNCGKLPSQNRDHGIYVEYARGTVITNNYIYDNADRGIQLYPDADGSVITNNVIDGNGQGIIFSGSGSRTSDDNVVESNVISNSRLRYNVEYYYADGVPAGRGNVVRHNCIFGGARGDLLGDGIAFTATEHVIAQPVFDGRDEKDCRQAPGSPCSWVQPARRPPPEAGG